MFNGSPRFWRILFVNAIGIAALVLGFYLGENTDLRWRAKPNQRQAQTSVQANDETAASKKPFPIAGPNSNAKGGVSQALGEETIADIAAQAAPSVVNIELAQVFPQEQHNSPSNSVLSPSPKGNDNHNASPNNDNAKFHVNPIGPPDISRKGFHIASSGSGLIIRPDGYIVTNNHLIRSGYEIKVTLSDQRAFKAKLIGRDMYTDVAVLKIKADHLPVVPFANSEEQAVRPGDWAIVIGNPLGYDHTVTLGIISAIHRSLIDLNAHVELIQTDAAINPGNSGGPLLNIRGKIIGLASAIRNDAQNIGFALPVATVEQVSNSLIKEGTIERPFLGLFMRDFDNRIIFNPRLPTDIKGVIVLSIVPDGPAQHAGICAGDFIESFAGIQITSAQEIRNITQKHKPGDKIELSLVREKKREKKLLTIGSYPTERLMPLAKERE
jgi:S1-C subfamily serine protease